MDLYDVRTRMGTGESIYQMPLRVTFYARVSTDSEEQAHSLQNQIDYYQSMIQNNNAWTFVDGYVDEGISGTSVRKREAFLKMIQNAKEGKFDFIITKEISRFSRNTLDSIQYTQELLKYGVGVLFQSDNINTFSPDAELRLTIMSSIAQDEVRKISERVKFGFKRAIEKGVVLGNNKIWGYTKETGRLVIQPEEAFIVREIFDLYANQGKGIRTICKLMAEKGETNTYGNRLTPSTAANILKNPKYKGYYCGNKSHKYDYKLNNRKYLPEEHWVIYQDEETVPPIVSEALWNKANQILKNRSKKIKTSGYNNKYPYSGKIYCGEHNEPYYRTVFRSGGYEKEVWQCRRYNEYGKAGCTMPIVYTAELDMVIQELCQRIFLDREKIVKEMMQVYKMIEKSTGSERKIEEKKRAAALLYRKKEKILDFSIEGIISKEEFSVRNEQYNKEILKLENIIQELSGPQQETLPQNLPEYILKEMDFNSGFDKGFLDAIIKKIFVYMTEEKHKVQLKVCPQFGINISFLVTRKRGQQASVCTQPYI